jgi:hypothetical protein
MAATAKVQVEKEGDATVFTVAPGGARRRTSLIVLGITLALLSWMFHVDNGPLPWVLMAAGSVMTLSGFRDLRPKSHRRRSVIRVSPRGIDVNGTHYPRESVKRLLVRNPLHSAEPARTVEIISGSAAEVAARINAGEPSRSEWAKLAEGTYELILDANHRDTVIAGNLSASMVDRLLRSLCDEAGLTYRA